MRATIRRTLLSWAVVCFAAACGGDSTSPNNSSVAFRIDALTCTGTSAVQLFADGNIIGTETLSAGQTSQAYPIASGTHALGARVANSTFIWPNTTVNIPANTAFTQLLPCR